MRKVTPWLLLQWAYENGALAYLSALPILSNPHERGTPMHRTWNEGYMSMEDSLRTGE